MEMIHDFEKEGDLQVQHPETKDDLVRVHRGEIDELKMPEVFDVPSVVNVDGDAEVVIENGSMVIPVSRGDLVLVKPDIKLNFNGENGSAAYTLIESLYKGKNPNFGDFGPLFAKYGLIEGRNLGSDEAVNLAEEGNADVVVFRGLSRLRPQVSAVLQQNPVLADAVFASKRSIDEVLAEQGIKLEHPKMDESEIKRYLEMMQKEERLSDGWWANPFKGLATAVGYDDYKAGEMRQMEQPHIHVSDAKKGLSSVELFIPQEGTVTRTLRTAFHSRYPELEWERDQDYFYAGKNGREEEVYKTEVNVGPGQAFIHANGGTGSEEVFDAATVSDEVWRNITIQSPGFSGGRISLQKK